jgi:large subunit ribosomal protein L13
MAEATPPKTKAPKPAAPKGEKKAKVAAKPSPPPAAKSAPARPADPNFLVVDADPAILGRAATSIAKQLLLNTQLEIVVINAEKAVITGSPVFTIAKFKARRARGKERMGPFYPRRADRIFKRAVRGMLPYQQERGRQAFKRIRVFHGVPPRYAGRGIKLHGAHTLRTAKFLTLQQLSESIGG